jgi:hypothetical protein
MHRAGDMKYLGCGPGVKRETGNFGAVCHALKGKEEMLGLCVTLHKGNRKRLGCVSFVKLERRNALIFLENIRGRERIL